MSIANTDNTVSTIEANQGFRYTLEDGREFHAASRAETIAQCPFLSGMPLEQANVFLDLIMEEESFIVEAHTLNELDEKESIKRTVNFAEKQASDVLFIDNKPPTEFTIDNVLKTPIEETIQELAATQDNKAIENYLADINRTQAEEAERVRTESNITNQRSEIVSPKMIEKNKPNAEPIPDKVKNSQKVSDSFVHTNNVPGENTRVNTIEHNVFLNEKHELTPLEPELDNNTKDTQQIKSIDFASIQHRGVPFTDELIVDLDINDQPVQPYEDINHKFEYVIADTEDTVNNLEPAIADVLEELEKLFAAPIDTKDDINLNNNAGEVLDSANNEPEQTLDSVIEEIAKRVRLEPLSESPKLIELIESLEQELEQLTNLDEIKFEPRVITLLIEILKESGFLEPEKHIKFFAQTKDVLELYELLNKLVLDGTKTIDNQLYLLKNLRTAMTKSGQDTSSLARLGRIIVSLFHAGEFVLIRNDL